MTEIIIGTTPTITYNFKVVSPSDFRTCILTIKCNGQILIEKTLSDAEIGTDSVSWTLTQAETSQSDWMPDVAPSLFAKVLAGQEGTDIGEWEQPDSTNPYMKGDKVTYNGKTYESVIDNNVWSPDTYPAGWKEIS